MKCCNYLLGLVLLFSSSQHGDTFLHHLPVQQTTRAVVSTSIFAHSYNHTTTPGCLNCRKCSHNCHRNTESSSDINKPTPVTSSVTNVTSAWDKAMMEAVRRHNKEVGSLVVRLISSLLPYADNVGHTVLHANNEFISYIMNLDETKVPHKWKGRIILFSIQLAQWGDNLGGKMLQMFHDIVKQCFDDEENEESN